MKSFEVGDETRDDYGTNNNRRLRKSGFVPGVVYGEAKDLKHIKLSHKDLIINLKNESFNSSILNLTVGKEKKQHTGKDLLSIAIAASWQTKALNVIGKRAHSGLVERLAVCGALKKSIMENVKEAKEAANFVAEHINRYNFKEGGVWKGNFDTEQNCYVFIQDNKGVVSEYTIDVSVILICKSS